MKNMQNMLEQAMTSEQGGGQWVYVPPLTDEGVEEVFVPHSQVILELAK